MTTSLISSNIPAIILGSQFPERNLIHQAKPFPTIFIGKSLTVFQIDSQEIYSAMFPSDKFSYEEKTQTLTHLVEPQFSICGASRNLTWTVPDYTNFELFQKYLLKANLVPDTFGYTTELKNTPFSKWEQFFSPRDFITGAGPLQTLHHFDPTLYQVEQMGPYSFVLNRLERSLGNQTLCDFQMAVWYLKRGGPLEFSFWG